MRDNTHMDGKLHVDPLQEPEIADLFEAKDVPAWVVEALRGAMETGDREASDWADALSLVLGRRANRRLRERVGTNPTE